MIIQPGTRVLAFDYTGFQATLDLDKIDLHYKPAIVTAIRSNNILCDVKFLHDNHIAKAVLVSMLRNPP